MVVPLQVAEEVEAVQAAHGLESVLLHKEGAAGSLSLEIEVRPRGEEANTLVWVTLLVSLPAGYPSQAVPAVEVYRSRGINDTQVGAAVKAAGAAIEQHGRQDIGCLVPIIEEVAFALASSVSECFICQEICKASEAIETPCGDVFHLSCLREWGEIKKKGRIRDAEKATAHMLPQMDALRREILQSEEHEEDTRRAVEQQRLNVQEAEAGLRRAERKLRAAMGEDVDDSEDNVSEEDDEEDEESSEELAEGEEGRDGRHVKIKFNNTGWGEGKKKNFKPSTSRNRGRAKKYLNKVEDKVEEMKEKARAEMAQKASPQIQARQRAQNDLQDARALLNRVCQDVLRDERKTEDLKNDLQELEESRLAQKDSIILVTIPCPVCQNPLDPDGVIEQRRASEAAESTVSHAETMRKRRAAEAAAGKVDIQLTVHGEGVLDSGAPLPREAQKLLGVYVREPEPDGGFPDGRPSYVGPKGCKLHFLQEPGSPGQWVVSLARFHKFVLDDTARTPDYADPASLWQVPTSEGFCAVRDLRALCANAAALRGEPQQPEAAEARPEEQARPEEPSVQESRTAAPQPPEPKAPARQKRPGSKKAPKTRRKKNFEELTALVAELVDSFAGDEERLIEAVEELLSAAEGADAKEALLAAVEAELAAAPRRRPAGRRRAAA